MAYNEKGIITDKDGKPVPQAFNETADRYEPVKGANGASFVTDQGAITALEEVKQAILASAGYENIATEALKYSLSAIDEAQKSISTATTAEEKASIAQELAEQILNGTIDVGVLKTNIEEKLANLEIEYAPKLTEVTASLATTVQKISEIKNNILSFGGKADGVTPNDNAFTAAKLNNSSNIYFPQNETRDAVYYFTSRPSIPYMRIYADEGVILSLPNNLSTYLITQFQNPVTVYDRERDATVVCYPKTDELVEQMVSIDDTGEVFIENVTLNDKLREFKYQTSGSTSVSGSFFERKTSISYADLYGGNGYVSTIPVDSGFYHSLGIPYAKVGDYFKIGSDSFLNTETNNEVRIGVIAGNNYNNFASMTLDINNLLHIGYINQDNNVAWSEYTIDFSDKLPASYGITKDGCLLGIRKSKENEFEFYVNEFLVHRMSVSFNIFQIGMAINHIWGNSAGMSNWQWLNPTLSKVKKAFIGDSINGVNFGDSVTYSEGNSITYPIIMGKMLRGTRGITKAQFENFAVSGNTAAQQYTIMQSKDLSKYNVVTIMVGINDVGRTNLNTFKTTIENMISYARGDSNNPRKVVIGMFEMYINKLSTGHGISTDSYYEEATPYRLIIQKAAIDKGIICANVLGEFGRVGIDNYMDYTKDNLHPNALGQVQIAKAFTKGIIRTFTNDVEIYEEAKYSLKYTSEFSDYSSQYNVTCTKEGNFVNINGLISYTGSSAGSGIKIADLAGSITTKNIIANATVRLSDHSTVIITVDLSNQIVINDQSFNNWSGKTIQWISLDLSYYIK